MTRAAQRHLEYQQHSHTTFQALRPVTTQLLLLRDQAEQLQPQLVALRNLLQELPSDGIEGCWDYVAFPLIILLDAIVPSRAAVRLVRDTGDVGGSSGSSAGGGGNGGGGGPPLAAACRSDRVVEALLGALLALLERSSAPSSKGNPGKRDGDGAPTGARPAADRSVAVLQHLAPLLQLGREEASEEVHIASQRCVAAALGPLAALAEAAVAIVPLYEDRSAVTASGRRQISGSSGAVLCGEDLVPLAGYMLHCCLEVSEREVLMGHRGSKALCAAALTSLGALLAALPDPEVLAFFLPGVVSGLFKHLYAAGSAATLSGPSVPPGAAATVQALACLRTAVSTVLSDESTAAILGPTGFVGRGAAAAASGSSGGGSAKPLTALPDVRSADDALSALKQLSLSSSVAALDSNATATHSGAAPAVGAGPSATAAAAAVAPPNFPDAATPQWGRLRRLRVDRTPGWLEGTSGRVNSLLGRALPPLCCHPRPAVRAELAATLAELLDRCGGALAVSQPLLLRLLFTLAQDEWQQVAAPCQAWVARHAQLVAATAGPSAARMASSSAAPFTLPVPSARDASAVGAVDRRSSGVLTTGADGAGGGGGSVSGAAAAAASSRNTATELKALEDEFERFMQGLMSDSVLLEQPALDLDERELHEGANDGAGARDQGAAPPPQLPAPARSGGSVDAAAPTAAAPLGGDTAVPSPAKPAAPPALSGLQCLIAEIATSVYLLRAVGGGQAEAVVQARCLTTALLVAGPGRIAAWLLMRPAALADLLSGLFRCFAFDRNAATLILHLRAEAGSYAPSVIAAAPTQAASGMSASASTAAEVNLAVGTVLAGGAAAAAELPRMPLGLLYLASQRSYSALAGVARSLGRLARAADIENAVAAAAATAAAAAASQLQRPGVASSVLRRLMGELGADLRRAVAHGGGGGAAIRGGWSFWEAAEGNGDDVDTAFTMGADPGGQSWQCEAAAVVAVAAEVIIGASNAWVPPLGAPAPPPPQEQRQQLPEAGRGEAGAVEMRPAAAFPIADPGFENILLGLLQELMRPAIITLPTHNNATSSRHAATAPAAAGEPLSYENGVHPDLEVPRRPLTAQALGENVMLLRVVLEAVGAAARAVGLRFVAQGRLLRTVLVPLLELLGDPAPPVAAAADTALQSICAHCGYGGSLTALLGANADYVVDSLCARLRDLQRYPRAPHMLAALLRRAGVAPQLLPLMAEPLQRTLQGLSPLARHWAPYYAHSYLAVLRELATGAAGEAAAAVEESQREVAELNRCAAAVRDRELALKAAAVAGAGWDAAAGKEGAAEATRRHEDVRQFFMEHNAAAVGDVGGSREAMAAEGQERRERQLLTLTGRQLDDSELRFRRLHAAAVVVGAAVNAVTPLLMSSDLHAAVTASEVLRSALATLAAATPAVEAEAAVMEEYGGPAARMRPVRPETPKVLPAVAAAWTPLMAALRDARTPVVERGVAAVADLVAVAGGAFLARRFQQEAWPVLQRLLTHGSAHTPALLSLGTDAARSVPRRRLEIGDSGGGGAGSGGTTIVSGGEDAAAALAPAAVTRVRVATLRCLEAVCRCTDAEAAVRTLTWGMAQAALPFLGSSHPPPLHEAAQATLLAVAGIDPDGVWLLLYETSYNIPPSLATAAATVRRPAGTANSEARLLSGAPTDKTRSSQQQPQPGVSEVRAAPGPDFPPLRSLLQPLPRASAGRFAAAAPSAQSQWPITTSVAADCGLRAQLLLAAVGALEAPWHRRPIPVLHGTAAE